MSNYLINTILPLTGLTSIQITQLISYLSPENAVIYGSSILYAYKNTLVLGNNSNIGDIDIAINSMTVLNNIKAFLTTALPYAFISTNDSHEPPVYLNVLYTTDNTVNYVLSQTSLPPNNTSMGTFILGNNGSITGNWMRSSSSSNYGPNPPSLITTFHQKNKLLLQLTYYDTTTSTVKDYIQTSGDFSVGSGTYDGTNFYISSDIDINRTVYRDPLNIVNNQMFKADWMLYRLKKYIDRGFLIYFDNQTQIDAWTNSLWMTPTSGLPPNYINYSDSFVCPFNLKPIDYTQSWILINNTNPIVHPTNYLINTILPLTGLTSIQITQLISYLSPQNAVIYGSSILYAYKNTLMIGSNNSNIGDVDIAINSLTVLNNIKAFLTTALPDATIYTNDSHDPPVYLNVLYTTDNTVNYLLSQTSLPPNNTSIGTFILGNNGDIGGNFVVSYLAQDAKVVPLITSFYQNNKLLLQLTYYDTTTSTVKDYIQTSGDFSVGSGTYDGTNFYISSDIDKNRTVYRDPLYVGYDSSLYKADWMLYRLKKYIDRGFLIYFDNQTQIDAWTNSLWMTPTSGYYTDSFVCPFNLKPIDYTQSFILIIPPPPPPPYPCFKSDTKILTNKGYIPIQDLRKGDLVKTALHNYKPIVMIGKRDIIHPASQERIKEQLYKCTKTNYPEIVEDLIITGCHCILVNDFINPEQREKTIKVNGRIFVTDKKYRLPACVDDKTVVFETPGTYTIYHFALENDNYYMNYGIYANGLLVETCSKRYLKEHSNMSLIE
jgi:hypothetical protein